MTQDSGVAELTADDQIVAAWAKDFDAALVRGDATTASSLFVDDGYLRDLVALTWHFRTFKGHIEIEQALLDVCRLSSPRSFRLTGQGITKRKRKIDGTRVIESILDFETDAGLGKAVLRLVSDPRDGQHRAWVLSTALDGLKDFPEKVGVNRPVGTPSLDTFGGKNWLDRRVEEMKFEDRDPEVLVVGAGQSGLALGARLRTLGVDFLVVDRLPRVGDVWRNRYHSLTLHNAIWLNHLPYLPFPDNWPVYIPKDKLANWFEFYADAMELNVWTSTELVESFYDEAAGRWHAVLTTSNGDERVVRPQHIVMATGASGIPFIPKLPGMEDFEGELLHSARYRGGVDQHGKRAVVFGTGNSGHDVAQDLHVSGGADVTMVQRSSTTVVDIETVHEVYDRHSTRLPRDLADLMLVATPYDMAVEAFRSMTAVAKQKDEELISQLADVGFRVDYGEDETGHRMKFLRYGGGYYINVGCSNLLADGSIDLLASDGVDRIVQNGVRLTDGTVLEADIIVLATGFHSQSELVRRIFGGEVAELVGEIWGYDEEGEFRGLYKRTGQPGLWFHAGGLTQSRVYSRFLALQLKACLEGLLDPEYQPLEELAASPK